MRCGKTKEALTKEVTAVVVPCFGVKVLRGHDRPSGQSRVELPSTRTPAYVRRMPAFGIMGS